MTERLEAISGGLRDFNSLCTRLCMIICGRENISVSVASALCSGEQGTEGIGFRHIKYESATAGTMMSNLDVHGKTKARVV